MINFTDDEITIKATLDSNADYRQFVQPSCARGYIFIQVGNGHVVLWHNYDDVFTSYLLPDELYYYRNNIDDIRRIANLIQNKATLDYQANGRP